MLYCNHIQEAIINRYNLCRSTEYDIPPYLVIRLRFAYNAENVVFLGPLGVAGKSHLAIAL
ncbi:MAG: hypothetical protein GAS50_12395 [Desulfobacterales bacterium]|nr:hypothetical protein [Desulfobacterales bacterium]